MGRVERDVGGVVAHVEGARAGGLVPGTDGPASEVGDELLAVAGCACRRTAAVLTMVLCTSFRGGRFYSGLTVARLPVTCRSIIVETQLLQTRRRDCGECDVGPISHHRSSAAGNGGWWAAGWAGVDAGPRLELSCP